MYQYIYIWPDGYSPQQLRSKTKITKTPMHLKNKRLPTWSFDGSSTKQAFSDSSDCLLKPVTVVRLNDYQYLVLCEVMTTDHKPHSTNTRAILRQMENIDDLWLGFEQEYVLVKDGNVLGWDRSISQGPFYCGVGHRSVAGREIRDKHTQLCIDTNIGIVGTNAEVLIGQWEYQIFAENALKAADFLWLSRYLLLRITEAAQLSISLHPKPLKGDWNGSGLHVNFSNSQIRAGTADIDALMLKMKEHHAESIELYGYGNHERLVGAYETSDIDTFTWGPSDRTASVRIPAGTQPGKHYLEDRRPAANADPYLVAANLLNIINPN